MGIIDAEELLDHVPLLHAQALVLELAAIELLSASAARDEAAMQLVVHALLGSSSAPPLSGEISPATSAASARLLLDLVPALLVRCGLPARPIVAALDTATLEQALAACTSDHEGASFCNLQQLSEILSAHVDGRVLDGGMPSAFAQQAEAALSALLIWAHRCNHGQRLVAAHTALVASWRAATQVLFAHGGALLAPANRVRVR
jgi:hypothetical protein